MWTMDDPSYGSMIRVNMGSYYHYGIFVDDKTIIQFGLPGNIYQDPSTIVVLKSSIEEFLQGRFLETRKYDKKELKKKRKEEEIVSYATSQIGVGGYDVLYNNCEHFANDCVFGIKKSSTIDGIREEVRKKLQK